MSTVRNIPFDAIVIDRAELPRVKPSAHVANSTGDDRATIIRELREEAIRRLALAEYLDAHPPVSDEDVETLAGEIRSFASTCAAYPLAYDDRVAMDSRATTLARRLLATGRVSVTNE